MSTWSAKDVARATDAYYDSTDEYKSSSEDGLEYTSAEERDFALTDDRGMARRVRDWDEMLADVARAYAGVEDTNEEYLPRAEIQDADYSEVWSLKEAMDMIALESSRIEERRFYDPLCRVQEAGEAERLGSLRRIKAFSEGRDAGRLGEGSEFLRSNFPSVGGLTSRSKKSWSFNSEKYYMLSIPKGVRKFSLPFARIDPRDDVYTSVDSDGAFKTRCFNSITGKLTGAGSDLHTGKTFKTGNELLRFTHDLITGCFETKDDVALSEMLELGDESDSLTPDFLYETEDSIVCVEVKTRYTTNEHLILDKRLGIVDKYARQLDERGIALGKPVVLYYVIFGKYDMYTNAPLNQFAMSTMMRMLAIGRSVVNSCKKAGLECPVFEFDDFDSSEIEKSVGSIKAEVSHISAITRGKAKRNWLPIPSDGLTQEHSKASYLATIQDWIRAGGNFFLKECEKSSDAELRGGVVDDHLLRKRIKSDRSSEMTKLKDDTSNFGQIPFFCLRHEEKEQTSYPRLYGSKFETMLGARRFRARSEEKPGGFSSANMDRLVKHLKKKKESETLAKGIKDWLSENPDHEDYREKKKELQKQKEMASVYDSRIKSNPAYSEKKVSMLKKSSAKTKVSVKIEQSDINAEYMITRGLWKKEILKKKPWMKKASERSRRESKKWHSLESDFSDIERDLEEMRLLINRGETELSEDEKTWWKHTLKAQELSGGGYEEENESMIRFLKSDLGRSLAMYDAICQELNISLRHRPPKNMSVYGKKLKGYPLWILYRPTMNNMQYSLIWRTEDEVVEPLHSVVKTFKDCDGQLSYTKFRTVEKGYLSQQMTVCSKVFSCLALLDELWHNSDDMEKTLCHMIFMILAGNARLAEDVAQARYAYMGTIEFINGKSRGMSKFSKLNAFPRNRYQAMLQKRFWINFLRMQDKVSRSTYHQDSTTDTWHGMVNWLTGEPIESFEQALALSYLHVLKNKASANKFQQVFKIYEKILVNEKPMASVDPVNTGQTSKPHADLQYHEINARFCSLMCDQLKMRLRSLGYDERTLHAELIREMHGKTIIDYATTKKSGSLPDSYVYTSSLKYPPNRTCLQRAIELLKQEKISLNPITDLPSLMEEMEKMGGIIVRVSEKVQLTGPREIFLMTLVTRICVNLTETMMRVIGKKLPNEMLTKPSQRLISQSNYEKRRKEKVLRLQDRCKASTQCFSINTSSDATKWNQGFVMGVFDLVLSPILPKWFRGYYRRILNNMQLKTYIMPLELATQFYKPEAMGIKSLTAPVTDELKAEWKGTKRGSEIFCLPGSQKTNCVSSMMQGILHYGSSVIHSIYLDLWETVTRTMVRRYMKEAKIDYEMVSYTRCSSDDSGASVTIIVPAYLSEVDKRKVSSVLNLAVSMKISGYKYWSARNSVKSADFVTNGLIEFNSTWTIGNTMVCPVLKFVLGSQKLVVYGGLMERQDNLSNLRLQCLENGASISLVRKIHLAQSYMYHLSMGMNVMSGYEDHCAALERSLLPHCGFFLFDPAEICGMGGMKLSVYQASRNSEKFSESMGVLFGRVGCSFNKEEGAQSGLRISFGDEKRKEKIFEEIGVTEEEIRKIAVEDARACFCQPRDSKEALEVLKLRLLSKDFESSISSDYQSDAFRLMSYMTREPCFIASHSVETMMGRRRYSHKVSLSSFVEDVLASKADRSFEELKPMIYPDMDVMDELLSVCDRVKELRRSEMGPKRRVYRKLTVVPRYRASTERVISCMRKLWFSVGNVSQKLATKVFVEVKEKLPWLREDYESTLKCSPFETYLSVRNFLMEMDSNARRISAFCVRSSKMNGDLMEFVADNSYRGYKLVLPADLSRRESSIRSVITLSGRSASRVRLERLSQLIHALLMMPFCEQRKKAVKRLLWYIREMDFAVGDRQWMSLSKTCKRLVIIANLKENKELMKEVIEGGKGMSYIENFDYWIEPPTKREGDYGSSGILYYRVGDFKCEAEIINDCLHCVTLDKRDGLDLKALTPGLKRLKKRLENNGYRVMSDERHGHPSSRRIHPTGMTVYGGLTVGKVFNYPVLKIGDRTGINLDRVTEPFWSVGLTSLSLSYHTTLRDEPVDKTKPGDPKTKMSLLRVVAGEGDIHVHNRISSKQREDLSRMLEDYAWILPFVMDFDDLSRNVSELSCKPFHERRRAFYNKSSRVFMIDLAKTCRMAKFKSIALSEEFSQWVETEGEFRKLMKAFCLGKNDGSSELWIHCERMLTRDESKFSARIREIRAMARRFFDSMHPATNSDEGFMSLIGSQEKSVIAEKLFSLVEICTGMDMTYERIESSREERMRVCKKLEEKRRAEDLFEDEVEKYSEMLGDWRKRPDRTPREKDGIMEELRSYLKKVKEQNHEMKMEDRDLGPESIELSSDLLFEQIQLSGKREFGDDQRKSRIFGGLSAFVRAMAQTMEKHKLAAVWLNSEPMDHLPPHFRSFIRVVGGRGWMTDMSEGGFGDQVASLDPIYESSAAAEESSISLPRAADEAIPTVVIKSDDPRLDDKLFLLRIYRNIDEPISMTMVMKKGREAKLVLELEGAMDMISTGTCREFSFRDADIFYIFDRDIEEVKDMARAKLKIDEIIRHYESTDVALEEEYRSEDEYEEESVDFLSMDFHENFAGLIMGDEGTMADLMGDLLSDLTSEDDEEEDDARDTSGRAIDYIPEKEVL